MKAEDPDTGAGTAGCAGRAEHEVLQEVLIATYWFDPGTSGGPYSVPIRFFGRRSDARGRPQPADRFEQVETVTAVPGSGPVSATTRIRGINAGEWIVKAQPVKRKGSGWVKHPRLLKTEQPNLKRFLWSKGNPVQSSSPGTSARTRMAALASGPGVVPFSWAAWVALGVLVALGVQAVLVNRAQLNVGAAMAVSLAACVAGALGARAWFRVLHQGKVTSLANQGLCIQGFILGVVVVAAAGLALARLPIGTFLDTAAPGLFLGIALGRQVCFFTGCCVGRPTASRLGIWASDRRIGARRVPTQQLESGAGLAIAVTALFIVLYLPPAIPGAVFVGAVAAYTLSRQVLFTFRAEPRKSSLGRPISMVRGRRTPGRRRRGVRQCRAALIPAGR